MSFGTVDRLMGTDRRDIILMSAQDARRLPVVDGAVVPGEPDYNAEVWIENLDLSGTFSWNKL